MKPQRRHRENKAIRLTGLAIQMGVTIYLGNLLGKWIENRYELSNIEQIATFVAIIISIYFMIRKAIVINIFCCYLLHIHFLDECSLFSSKCFLNQYVYHILFSFITTIFFITCFKLKKFIPLLGFIYLGILTFKLLLYYVLFETDLIVNNPENYLDKIHFIIPVFLGLFIEVFILKKILDKVN